MKTSTDFLDAVRTAHALTSDYQLARFLGVRQQTISNYRTGRTCLDEAMALRIADALAIDPAEVFASIAAERTGNERARRVWEQLAKKLGGAAAALVFGLLLSPSPADAAPSVAFRSVHIMLSRLRALFPRWFVTLGPPAALA